MKWIRERKRNGKQGGEEGNDSYLRNDIRVNPGIVINFTVTAVTVGVHSIQPSRVCDAIRDVRGRCILAITDYAANWRETGGGDSRCSLRRERMIEVALAALPRCAVDALV